jgi:hypothetical protein
MVFAAPSKHMVSISRSGEGKHRGFKKAWNASLWKALRDIFRGQPGMELWANECGLVV